MSVHTLNKSQKQAVEYVDGPLIIIAGAGTGKTTVVTKKIKYIIDQKLAKPEEILALTFNEKAASEMQERVDEMMDIGYVELQISTFHSFCQNILEQFGLDIGLPNYFKILEQTDIWLLLRKNLDKFNMDYYKPLGNPNKYLHELVGHFSKCKDEMISVDDYMSYAENLKTDMDSKSSEEKDRLKELADAYRVYNQILLDSGSLDFGDLIFWTNKLFDKRLNILNGLQKKYKYILVDEFQDVNWSQYTLIQKLSRNNTQLTVVGDDDQSIYAFRGASVSNILRFKDDFSRAKEIILKENYRSQQEILDKSYDLIQKNNPDRLEVKLKINKKLESKISNQKTSVVIHSHTSNIQEEADFVVNEIKRIKKIDKEVDWDDFAILIRANSHAEPFLNALEYAGLPYEFMAASGLYRQPIVLDCLNFLKVVNSYHESTAIYRLLRLPFFKMKENDIQKLTHNARKLSISYYEALKSSLKFELSKEGILITEKIIELIHSGMKDSRDTKPSSVLYKFIKDSGYLKYLTTGIDKNDKNITHQIHQLNQFFDYIVRYEDITAGASVFDFLDHFEQVLDSGDLGKVKQPQDTPNSINIMTIHTAKGLEYKYVFIVNLVEQRFPTRKHGNGIEIPLELIKEQLPQGDSHYQEERRLFYVAMTRAKEKLYLLNSDNLGGTRKAKPSRFLEEINYSSSTNTKEESNDNELKIKNRSANPKMLDDKDSSIYLLPKSFSFSQIQKYQRCPYQYKLSKILSLPTEGSPSMTFGTTMHTTLQKFYEEMCKLNNETLMNTDCIQAPTLERLLEIYEESLGLDWYKSQKQREDYYLQGKKILKDFYKKHKDKWIIPVIIEGSFTLKIGKHLIKGKIDRVDRMEDGVLEIIDYKTGAAKDELKTGEKDQLMIYQMAISSIPDYKDLGEIKKLTYYYLHNNSEISFLGKEKNLIRLEEKIVKVINNIEEQNFKAKPNKHVCKLCDYKDICDYRA